MGYSTARSSESASMSSAPPPPPSPLQSQTLTKDRWSHNLGALFPISFLIFLTSPKMLLPIGAASAVVGLVYLAIMTAKRLTRRQHAQLR